MLRDAGFDMDLGGDDIISVQYQNANNSVRVSDEFMRAVEATDDEGEPSGCAPGRPVRSSRPSTPAICSARSRRPRGSAPIPGIQYDDTINDWHTSPESGPDHRVQPVQRVHAPGQFLLQPGFAEPDEVPVRRRRVRRADLRQGGGVRHHRDGHLDLLRRLPDPADRRDHARFPAAGHRLRQPGRAADGHRARLRLGGRPVARRGHHLADDAVSPTAVRPSWPASSARTTGTPATPTRTSGSSASTPPPTTTSG